MTDDRSSSALFRKTVARQRPALRSRPCSIGACPCDDRDAAGVVARRQIRRRYCRAVAPFWVAAVGVAGVDRAAPALVPLAPRDEVTGVAKLALAVLFSRVTRSTTVTVRPTTAIIAITRSARMCT